MHWHADMSAGTRPEPEITRMNPTQVWHLFVKLDLGPKAKFIEWDKICVGAGYQKMKCPSITTGTRFYHTQNSNHFGQKIGLEKHKLNLLC